MKRPGEPRVKKHVGKNAVDTSEDFGFQRV